MRNVGRDAVYLVAIGGTAADGTEWTHRFFSRDGHLILAPGEPDSLPMERRTTVLEAEDQPAKRWVRMWVRDISGKRFPIAKSSERLAELWSEPDTPSPKAPRSPIPM
ncbi:hypothetical protein DF165_17295 [Burkholderia cenocepacia]|nr:hypothetical protein DF165_17295 [Burkholderia cenocepacia]